MNADLDEAPPITRPFPPQPHPALSMCAMVAFLSMIACLVLGFVFANMSSIQPAILSWVAAFVLGAIGCAARMPWRAFGILAFVSSIVVAGYELWSVFHGRRIGISPFM